MSRGSWSRAALALLGSLSLVAAVPLAAQASGVAPAREPPRIGVVRPYDFRSPVVDNHAAAAAVVFEKVLRFPGATMVQVEFGGWHLPRGGWLEVASLADGDTEPLPGPALAARAGMTAYFNGDALRIRLHAGPLSKRSFFRIKTVAAGSPASQLPETICGATDSRLLSGDKRVARIILRLSSGFSWCTAWLISPVNAFASAGHCIGIANLQSVTAQFNVPPSTSSGALVNPPASDQYVWDPAVSSRAFENAGVGKDWSVFRTQKNTVTGLHAGRKQRAYFEFTKTPPRFTNTRITGHGSDSTPNRTRNGVQQSAIGPLIGVIGTRLQYRVDTTGGSSGSPVFDAKSGKAFGVHTHGGCTTNPLTSNSGTAASHPGFAAARARLSVKQGVYTTFGAGCQGSGGIGACTVLPKAYASKMGQSATLFPHSRPGMRYQQVFLGSEIGGRQTWAELCLRLDEKFGGPAGKQTITVKLGPTAKDHTTLSKTFAANWSGPATTVFTGTLNLPAHAGGGGVGDFKVCVKFPRHYVYAGGNLLVEIVNRSSTSAAHFEDMASGPADVTTARAYAFRPTATSAAGLFRNQGLCVCLRLRGTLTPQLSNTGVPMIGKSFRVDLAKAKPSTAALLSLGRRVAIPLPPSLARGCTLYATLDILGAVATDGQGNAAITLPIPNVVDLLCVKFANQYLVLDRVNGLGVVLTNGGEAEIGG